MKIDSMGTSNEGSSTNDLSPLPFQEVNAVEKEVDFATEKRVEKSSSTTTFRDALLKKDVINVDPEDNWSEYDMELEEFDY